MNIVGPFQCQDKWCSLLLLWLQVWLFYLFFITESKQVGHGWFTFCKSMLIVLNYLLFQAARICFKGTSDVPHQMYPSGIMGLYDISCLKEFLTQTLSTVGRCWSFSSITKDRALIKFSEDGGKIKHWTFSHICE